jgi:hypothetical protein
MKRLILSALLMSCFYSQAQQQPSLEFISTYRTGIFDDGAAEISAFDPGSKKLVFVNAANKSLEILDISNVNSPLKVDSINIATYGNGANSVAISNGKIIAAVENVDKQENGKVVFFEMDGSFIKEIEVGALPDMVTVSPNGNTVLVACEGEPNDDYSKNPNGTIYTIDISGGINSATATEINFEKFETIRNSFDSVGDWNYTLSPASYSTADTNYVSGNKDIWSVINEFSGKISPVQGNKILGIQDIDNSISGAKVWHKATFDAVDISNKATNGHISFYYNSIGFDSSDSLGYIAQFNNGSNWDFSNFVKLDNQTNAWQQVKVNIPSGSNYVRLQLLAKQNGASDYAAFDKVEIRFIDESTNIFENKLEHTVQSELEPEYITVDENSEFAYVVFQENNAMAKIKLADNSIELLKGLGYKDHSVSGFGFDGSDKDGAVNITTQPVFGMYQPDAIASFTINGSTFIATANEGDGKEYDEYEEETKVSKLDLDTNAFTNIDTLQSDEGIGRLKVTETKGDTNFDGYYESLYSYGARSFSIFDENLNLVYDSGDEFAQTIKDSLPSFFNADNDDNDSFDKRSDNKGSEPEAVTIGKVGDNTYAFIGLERIGGVMVYDVSTPTNPSFVQYVNNRDFTFDATHENAKDLAPEGILFIPASESPNSKNLVITSNEVSGTVSFFSFENENISVNENNQNPEALIDNQIVFGSSYSGKIEIYNSLGQKVFTTIINNQPTFEIPQLNSGIHLIKTNNSIFKMKK